MIKPRFWHQKRLLATISLAIAVTQAGAVKPANGEIAVESTSPVVELEPVVKLEPAVKLEPVVKLGHVVKFGDASSVKFQVSIFGLFKKQGSFTDINGALSVQNNTAQVKARIQTASATMKSQSDAELLKSPAYFDAAHFPEIVFQSVRFPIATLRNGGQINGTLTLRGISQQQIFKLSAKPCGLEFVQTPWRCGFDVVGTLKRSEFGMKARRGIVSDEVELTLSVAAPAKVPPKTQTENH